MEVFRISTPPYSKKLTASGRSARWNKDNEFVLYTGQSRSLTSLELVVHKKISSGIKYEVMVISIADSEHLFSRVHLKDLPKNWQSIYSYPFLQSLGSDWYVNNKSLVLQVPSAIIPQEYNYIINTRHPDFAASVTLVRQEDFFWDSRLVT